MRAGSLKRGRDERERLETRERERWDARGGVRDEGDAGQRQGTRGERGGG